ncbi:MAG: hypothetical protein LBL78_02405 [Prevotellaceae bacterium]|jgi:hypothetical protein|nr:hypothetical protein [Prevotellaceae bacterium]
MKKTLCVLAFLIAGLNAALMAQGRMQDVVYLKNGSIIKGIVLEQVPGQSLKIKTRDGSIFVYNMSDVTRIVKEGRGTDAAPAGQFMPLPSDFTAGYRGMVDFGYTIGTGDYGTGRLELTTSHGYQFNPYLFIGGGVGLQYFNEAEVASFPIFADIRGNFLSEGTFIPFAVLKAGYTAGGDIHGLYLAPAIGVKWVMYGTTALNLTLGYTYQDATASWYYNDGYSHGYYNEAHVNTGGITLKLGFEF